MARYNPLKPSFAAGSVSPLLDGRSSSLDQMVVGARRLYNCPVIVEGPAVKAPGTYDILSATGAAAGAPFIVSADAIYVMLFYENTIRFITSSDYTLANLGFVLTAPISDAFSDEFSAEFANDVTPAETLELTSPYTAAQAPDVRITQSANVAYLEHPEHTSYKLTRVSANEFSLEPVEFRGGQAPLGAFDTTGNRIIKNVAGGAGDRRLTFDRALDPEVFLPGRIFYAETDLTRLSNPAEFCSFFATIDQINPSKPTQLDVTITSEVDGDTTDGGDDTGNGDRSGTLRTDRWALAVFSAEDGATPGRGANDATFFEGRLVYAGFADAPDRFQASVTDSWDDFELSDGDPDTPDSINADKSITRPLVSDKINEIYWVVGVERGLLFGTSSSEFVVTGTDDGVMTPLGVRVRATTQVGSRNTRPAVINGEVFYIEKDNQTLRRFAYSLEKDAFRTPEAFPLAEHLGRPGLKKLVYQQAPHRILWALRDDGTFAGWTINDDQQFYAGWERELVNTTVVDAWTVPGSQIGESDDLLYMLVDRTAAGVTRRRLELMTPFWRPNLPYRPTTAQKRAALAKAEFLEASVTFMNRTAAITATSGAIFTVANSFSPGDRVRVGAATGLPVMQGSSYLVSAADSTTVTVTDLAGGAVALANIDAGDSLALYQEVSSLSGLDHLEEATVSILADGFRVQDQVVDSGAITLEYPAAVVYAGLSFECEGVTTRFSGKPTMGYDDGDPIAISHCIARVHQSVALSLSRDDDGDFETKQLTDDPDMPFFSGDVEFPLEGSWEDDATVRWFDQSPWPLALLSLRPSTDSSDR